MTQLSKSLFVFFFGKSIKERMVCLVQLFALQMWKLYFYVETLFLCSLAPRNKPDAARSSE